MPITGPHSNPQTAITETHGFIGENKTRNVFYRSVITNRATLTITTTAFVVVVMYISISIIIAIEQE